MKTLFAVVSAHSREAYREMIRQTWLPLFPQENMDVRFFLGRGTGKLKDDEVSLNCDDSYEGLPEKVQCIAQWALDNGYDRMAKCDDDVVVCPRNLFLSGYHHGDFIGRFAATIGGIDVPYGFLYWLSQRGMQYVVSAHLPQDNNDEWWVTRVLETNGIRLRREELYFVYRGFGARAAHCSRPLRRYVPQDSYPENFVAICITLGTGPEQIPHHYRLAEFLKVFNERVRSLGSSTILNQ